MRVMVTGHRPQRLKGKEAEIRQWLQDQVAELSPELAITGMAQGVDIIYGEVAEEANIPVVCAFPYKKKRFYQNELDIMHKASYINFISEGYSNSCFTLRDRWMVDNSDFVLVVWDGDTYGGTYQTMKYAEKLGKEMRIFKI